MLGRLGVHKPFTVNEGDVALNGRRLLSDGAAFIVADILSDNLGTRQQDCTVMKSSLREWLFNRDILWPARCVDLCL